MPNFTETAAWVSVAQLEDGQPAGANGEDDVSNAPHRDHVKRAAYLKAQLELLGLSSQYGDSTFAGSGGQVITHNLGHTEYSAHVHATADSGGALGDVWIVYGTNTITIYNSGAFTGTLRWGLVVGTELGA